MKYRGYTVRAEVQAYESWGTNDDGRPVRYNGVKELEITGYDLENTELARYEFIEGECTVDEIKSFIDSLYEEDVAA